MQLDTAISAVVTGGASGLGAATAGLLASRGVRVALFDLQAEKGEALAAELGGVFCQVDVTDDASVDAGFAKARATRPGAHPHQLRGHLQRDQDREPIERRRCDQAFPARCVRSDHPDQPGRHIPLHRQVGGGDADARSERTASAARSSTPPASPRRTGRSARPPMRRRRAGWSA